MIKILTIAGSDCSGGAGVQADLKTIAALSGYGMSVITALTSQNTMGVLDIYPTPGPVIESQLEAVLSDIGADGVKTGMLVNEEAVSLTASKLKSYGTKNLVIDPVMFSETGTALLDEAGRKALIRELFPLARLCTPNRMEAEYITGKLIRTPSDMIEASRMILDLGPKAVLIKGGHIDGDALDVLNIGGEIKELSVARVDNPNTHGSGCTLSASLAVFAAQGFGLEESVRRAKEFITTAIKYGRPVGRGGGPVNHTAQADRRTVLQALSEAAQTLVGFQAVELAPEVQINLGYAMPDASGREDIAAFPARIVKYGRSLLVPAPPVFGGSRHVAKIILTAQRADPAIRSVMNISYSRKFLERAEELRMSMGSFDRREEPREVKEKEGSSLEWGVDLVIRKLGRVPELISDAGDVGKEPMIRILGRDPREVTEKALKLLDSAQT